MEHQEGQQGVKEFTYGYKLHLLVDCEYESPVAANISVGDVHYSQRPSNLLSEARFTYGRFGSASGPRYVLTDQGIPAES